MRDNLLIRVSCLLLALGGLLPGCTDGGGDLLYAPEAPDKFPPDASNQVRTALYIDTDLPDAVETLTAAGKYELAGSGILYFDYVILGGAYIRAGTMYPRLDYSAPLLAIVQNWATLIRPLRDKGIKVLCGISGGGEGVSFGTISQTACEVFARECADFCRYYGLDGVEFYDINGENAAQTPYPALGGTFWNGEGFVEIGEEDTFLLEKSWEEGSGNFADMMSYLIEALGASSSFQGDLDPDARERTPILIREVNFVKYLPSAVPRYAFASTLSCFTYLINDAPEFGYNDEGISSIGYVANRFYAPVIIDMENIDAARLAKYAQRLGTLDYGTEDAQRGKCGYGLVYYTNMRPPFAGHTKTLTTVSLEVYGEGVVYRP